MINEESSFPAITLRQISFSYSERPILRGIDLTVPRGSYFGIVGPNGSGKTTLAYLISGILSPREGKIDTYGNRVGLVLANPANQVVSLMVEEDIAFGPENLELPGIEIGMRIDRALAAIRGGHLRQSLTTALSGGELAKVVFAGQLVLDADIFVLDEGTVMLDPVNRQVLLETIRSLNRDMGKTIIHISHRLDDLEASNLIAVIEKGEITVREQGVFDLAKRMEERTVPGIEPGARVLYRLFLLDSGITVPDLKEATRELARRLKSGIRAG